MNTGEFEVDGVRVETYGTDDGDRPPLLFVHGGTQGSWAWERIAPRLAGLGWYGACLNWYGHNGSRPLPEPEALTRSIADVTREIGLVADRLGRTPVVVGHSMGGMAATIYATRQDVVALVLVAPVAPAAFAGADIPLDVDPGRPYLLPEEIVDAMFWDRVGPDTARRYRGLLSPESPRAVVEATRWLLDPDVSTITAPTLVFGADADPLSPATSVRALAEAVGATYVELAGEGHGIPQNPVSEPVADRIGDWLRATALSPAGPSAS